MPLPHGKHPGCLITVHRQGGYEPACPLGHGEVIMPWWMWAGSWVGKCGRKGPRVAVVPLDGHANPALLQSLHVPFSFSCHNLMEILCYGGKLPRSLECTYWR